MLVIENTCCCYGKKRIIEEVSLRVDSSEIVCLVGANGAGKTTTLKMISGLKKTVSGNIYFDNKKINDLRPEEIVKLGIIQVPEGRQIFIKFSVLENLQMGAFLRNDKKGIKEDLEIVYTHFPILKQRSAQKGGSLSGGQQQMLAIARALMGTPKMLLLDEPSLGLAPMLVEEIGRIITEINEGGKPILLVEQNASMALNLSSRGYVLELGHIVLEGEAKMLLENESVKKSYLGIS